jgi:hypothetical protein
MERSGPKNDSTEATEAQNPAASDDRETRIDDDAVARSAYRRFEERGREHGRDMEDWLEAEREVRGTGE